MYLKQK